MPALLQGNQKGKRFHMDGGMPKIIRGAAKPVSDEDLFLYLSVSEVAVNSVLIREVEGKQKPVYYLSKVLQDVEKRYPRIDKMALALITWARKSAAVNGSRSSHSSEGNEANLRGNLDLLDEVRAQALDRVISTKQRVARHYNGRVRTRIFRVGDLVLRKLEVSDPKAAIGKLSPNWEGPYKGLEVNNHLLLMIAEVSASDSRPEIISPSKPAALAASKQT
ncbi:hypothetical protein RJ639_042081 [Escallonia herrerae]|uniref:Reverse transcriptase/retrotransposon-derived protein RNase H-like domain-containing protein n=1 Tax=Escallonia herrerae TaxID=1293975 RepID=A0AA88WGK5_9ASTE|nr:hypothetical protein RJ639_042081 [Escallonia herrerae]